MRRLAFLLITSLLLSSCVTGLKARDEEEVRQELQDKAEIEAAFKASKDGDFKTSLEAFRTFSRKGIGNAFWLQSKLGEADALHQLGESQQALTVLQYVRDVSLSRKPEAAAQASYRMSFIFEDLGEPEKTLAALNEAETQRGYLPERISRAQIPARKAMVYAKLGERDLARQWLDRAERGLSEIRSAQKSTDLAWLAETYFQMGRVSSQSQFASSWDYRMDTLSIAYPLLYKAALQQVEPWSPQAEAAILQLYQEAFNVLFASKEKFAELRSMATKFLVVIEKTSAYRPQNINSVPTTMHRIYTLEDEMKKKLTQFIYSPETDMSLTPEAAERNSIKRFYRLIEPLEIPKPVEGEDPNL